MIAENDESGSLMEFIYSLQETDIQKDKLEKESKQKEIRLLSIDKELQVMVSSIEAVKAGNSHFIVELRKFEGKIDDLNKRKEQADSKRGSVTSAKQLDAIEGQIESLTASLNEKEETLLSMYEEQEVGEQKLADLSSALDILEKSLADEKSTINTELHNMTQERALLYEKRERLLSQADDELIGRYEKLYEKLGGQIIFDAEDMICPGCGMALPRRLFDRMASHRDLFYDCNNCSRLLRYVGV